MYSLPAFKDIIDTTFRDGQQSPLLFDTYKYRFQLEEKKLLIKGLIELGVSYFEFFSPIVSKDERNDFIQLREYARSISSRKLYFYTHCRCNEQDIEKAMELGFDGLNLYMGISQNAQKYSYHKNFDEILDIIVQTIQSTRAKYPNIYIRISTEDAFRTPLKDIFKVYDAVYRYVNTIGMPDTVGVGTPVSVTKIIKTLKKRYPKVNIECHFHNDRGYSLINTMTAIRAGVHYVDASIWGLAERSGITSLTGFLFNLYNEYPKLSLKYHLHLCYPLNILMGTILKLQVPYSEPVSLTNRTHTAGVHQKAVINNSTVYEAHKLAIFGVSKNQILLGPLSGWNLIYYYVKDIMGYDIDEKQAKDITKLFKSSIYRISQHNKPETLLNTIVQSYTVTKHIIPKNHLFKRVENLN